MGLRQADQRLQQPHGGLRDAVVVAANVLVIMREDLLRRRGETRLELALNEEDVALQLLDRPQCGYSARNNPTLHLYRVE